MPLEWVKKKKKHQPVIKPNFEVATWKGGGLNLRAYFNQVGEPQWLFERVHQHLTGQCEGGVYLRRNIESLKDTMQAFQVPLTELSYKGVDHVVSEEEPWTDHTLTSRALLVFLFFAAKPPTKKFSRRKGCSPFISLQVGCFIAGSTWQ